MALSHNTKHVEEGLARLTNRYRGKPNIEAILTSWLEQIQDAEDLLWEVIEERYLANAEGVQLDTLGKIVDEARKNRSDTDYRLVIRVKIRALKTKGHSNDILAVLMLTALDYEYVEMWPASFEVSVFNTSTFAFWLSGILNLTKAAGVGKDLKYSSGARSGAFMFDTVQAGATIEGEGFDTSTMGTDVGGILGSVI